MADSGMFEPVRVMELEIGEPIPDVRAADSETGRVYARALCLVRLHTHPLGVVELTLDEGCLSAPDLVRAVGHSLEQEIAAHLRKDGLPEIALGPDGLPSPDAPRCLEARRRVLADPPFATIVVPTRDRTEALAACLDSLLALAYPAYEIVVVDNAPGTDATADLVRGRSGDRPSVRYVREDRPGTSWARNRGLAEARGEIVAFTDDDVLADRHWLAALATGFSAAENVACVTGMTPPQELETRAQLWFEQYGAFSRRGFERRIFDLGEHRPRAPLFPYSAGMFGRSNNTSFRRSVLESIGGFDPAMGPGTPAPGCEDLAVHAQVILRGCQLVYEPAAIVHHLHRRDYRGLYRQVYGSGVGLTAYLTKCVLEDPRLLVAFAAKAPRGLMFALGAQSAKNAGRRPDFPRELRTLERSGWVRGPLAYLRGRWQAGAIRRRFGPIVSRDADAPGAS